MSRKVNSFKSAEPEFVLKSKPKAALNPPGAKPKPKAEPVVELEHKPARQPPEIEKRTLYEVGYDVGYMNGTKDSIRRTIHSFVAAVEGKLAEHDGYKDIGKWRQEATIPAWWIAVLMSDWESKNLNNEVLQTAPEEAKAKSRAKS